MLITNLPKYNSINISRHTATSIVPQNQTLRELKADTVQFKTSSAKAAPLSFGSKDYVGMLLKTMLAPSERAKDICSAAGKDYAQKPFYARTLDLDLKTDNPYPLNFARAVLADKNSPKGQAAVFKDFSNGIKALQEIYTDECNFDFLESDKNKTLTSLSCYCDMYSYLLTKDETPYFKTPTSSRELFSAARKEFDRLDAGESSLAGMMCYVIGDIFDNHPDFVISLNEDMTRNNGNPYRLTQVIDTLLETTEEKIGAFDKFAAAAIVAKDTIGDSPELNSFETYCKELKDTIQQAQIPDGKSIFDIYHTVVK